MTDPLTQIDDPPAPALAYLVIREGAKWSDVFRLVPGESVTIGRAPTNQIVIKDERCSRTHAELFVSGGAWVLRDLDSRNGTAVGQTVIREDYSLQPGDIIRIGRAQLAFVDDLSKAFSEFSGGATQAVDENAPPRVSGVDSLSGANLSTDAETARIMHRRGRTRYLSDQPGEGSSAAPGAGQLCRLAFELAQAPDAQTLAKLALDGLFEATRVDGGALLVVRRGVKNPTASDIEIVGQRTDGSSAYHPLSPFLATSVLREGEAVLARNVLGDSVVQARDSQGEIHANSIICAPMRRGDKTFCLIHLYSTRAERVPDPDDLEFTLAVADTVAVALSNLSRRQELAENLTSARNENVQLRERLGVQSEIVGKSRTMMRIADEIARAAPSNATVLVRGESGVGKELVARAVHFSSARRKGPFVCVNCAALSESLLESELFGHERGAFTGAFERKIGKFEAAHRGTLLLDEIGEMSATTQAKLLRVLEGHSFERVGGAQPIKIDVRVIAATNRDLEKDAGEGRFRRDLYFRLHVLEIVVPALRKRIEDIPELAHYFFHKFNMETGRKLQGFTARAMEQMARYRWPGNVRELKNVVERAVVLAPGEYIDQEDLMLSNLPTAGDTGEAQSLPAEYKPMTLEEVERRHILATLKSTGWNKSQTAAVLGIERSTLDRKIRRYELTENFPRRAV